jgi:hypothetical protein
MMMNSKHRSFWEDQPLVKLKRRRKTMNNYLQNQPPVYNRFINNQVLTESQLNSVLNHLNYQDKLSRVSLTGVGIVCGLEVTQSSGRVGLTGGVGITTDGDLIKMSDSEFTNFRRFSDSEARYSRFIRNNDTIPLWELTGESDASDVHSLETFSGMAGFTLSNAVALIYLEYYHREPENCSPVDCNSQGKEVVNRPRILLISAEDAEFIIKKDSIHSELLNNKLESIKESLKPIRVRRVVHSGKKESLNRFTETYAKKTDFDEVLKMVRLLASLPVFKSVFEDVKADLSVIEEIKPTHLNTQYIYSFYRDLADSLNEISRILRQNITLCCPDASAFPKHLLLGSFRQTARNFRHSFYPSPALNYPGSLGKLQNEFEHLLLLIRDFQPVIQKEVRITPSRDMDYRLKKRAIPVYYNLEASDDPQQFVAKWRENGFDPVPNYFGFSYEGDYNPLDFHLEGHDFFRIEGHVGGDVSAVLEEIKEIKKNKGLAFKVLPVSMDSEVIENTIDEKQFEVYFEDLQTVLDAWNRERECMIKNAIRFLSGFSLEKPGEHIEFTGRKKEDASSGTDVKEADVLAGRFPAHSEFGEISRDIPLRTGRKNAVIGGIDYQKDYTGELLQVIVQENYSRNDIIANMHRVITERELNMDDDLAKVIINSPVNVISHVKEAEDKKIEDPRDFTEDNVKTYREALDKLCAVIKQERRQFQLTVSKRADKFSSYEWVDAYSQVFFSLSQLCCFSEKMEELHETIKRRRAELFSRFQMETFIKNHPGAEHFGGVPQGGTFIVLYSSGASAQKLVRGSVVGDLCLPYICCSDGPSATFVIPDQKVHLSLPVDHICMKKDESAEVIRLDVSPVGAEVKAFIEKKEIESAIEQDETALFFNPNNVEESDFGKTIHFTADGIRMEPTLKMYEKPEPEFSVSETIQFSEDKKSADIIFRNHTEGREKFTFTWNFGDGHTAENNEEEVTHSFIVTPGREFTFEVGLKVSNGPCSATVTDELIIQVPESEDSDPLPDPETRCKDFTLERMEGSLQDLERQMRENRRNLASFNPFMNDDLQPLYRSVIEEIDVAIKGEMDEKIDGFIFRYMRAAQQLIQSQSEQEQVFSLKIYFELILLYIYVRGCRSGKMDPFERPTDAVPGWVDFVRSVQTNFPDVFRALLRTTSIVEKVETVIRMFDGKFSREMERQMQEIMNMMQEMSG